MFFRGKLQVALLLFVCVSPTLSTSDSTINVWVNPAGPFTLAPDGTASVTCYANSSSIRPHQIRIDFVYMYEGTASWTFDDDYPHYSWEYGPTETEPENTRIATSKIATFGYEMTPLQCGENTFTCVAVDLQSTQYIQSTAVFKINKLKPAL